MTYEEMYRYYNTNINEAWDTIAHYAQSANDTTLKENADRYFAARIDPDTASNIREKAILSIMERTRELPRIKLIVSNVVEDEKGTGGLWDLAAELRAIIEPSKVYTGDELQQYFYDILRKFASYEHPEHDDNSGS